MSTSTRSLSTEVITPVTTSPSLNWPKLSSYIIMEGSPESWLESFPTAVASGGLCAISSSKLVVTLTINPIFPLDLQIEIPK